MVVTFRYDSYQMGSALGGNKQVLIRTCVVLSDFGSLDCIYLSKPSFKICFTTFGGRPDG